MFLAMFVGKISTPATASEKPKFQVLYNGKNLDGWEVQGGKLDSWKADGEMLSCVKGGGGWLRTKKQYSDFILKIDFRIPKGGNSGVGIRFPGKGDPAHAGMEIQVLDDDAPQYKKLQAAQYTGGIYYQAAAKRGHLKKQGEWNSYEIKCVGHHVQIQLNGTVINDAMLNEYTDGKGGHKALADRPQVGYIGMQNYGSRVDFRNIQLKNLVTTTASGLQYVDLKEGKGKVVSKGATVTVHYTGRLVSGKKFDSSRDRGEPATFPLSGVIKGWQEGIPGMKVGGKRKLIIPSALAYGEAGFSNVIPPNATLVFHIEVLEVK